ncbi:hypothetical protein D3C79_1078220 [compost metagenome]
MPEAAGKIKQDEGGTPDQRDSAYYFFQGELISKPSAKTAEQHIDERINTENIAGVEEGYILLSRQK